MAATALAIFVALAWDAVLGDPPNRLHPVVAMGRVIRGVAERARGGPGAQFAWGILVLAAGAALFSAPWIGISVLMRLLPWWAQGLILGICLKPVFALRRLIEAGAEVRRALERSDLREARRLVGWHLVSRPTARLTRTRVASAVVESLAENLTDSFLAPLLCFAVGGLPLAWLYRYVNTADASIGYRTERYEYLGKASARLDDLLNWGPARLAAVTLVAGAALCGQDAGRAWRVMALQHRRTASPNAGWTMASAAGALGVKLQKVGHYQLDGGPSLPGPAEARAATRLVLMAACLCVVITLGVSCVRRLHV
jgi:adenosylcobinamide-phosphate synthase